MVKLVKLSITLMFFVCINIYSQQIDRNFYIDIIQDEYIGVYLPNDYINALRTTKNHAYSLLLNNNQRHHDVLIVEKNIIRSNARWHDLYAIRANEAVLYQFIELNGEKIIIDNNGFQYTKIGDDTSHYTYVENFVLNIVFENILNSNIGAHILDRQINLPFLYFFTGIDYVNMRLNIMFIEDDANILLSGRDSSQRFFTFFMIIEENEYIFYEEAPRSPGSPYSYKLTVPFFHFNLEQDKEILIAASGLTGNDSAELLQYLDNITDYQRRIIINGMFALNGYHFNTQEWQSYFNRFSWYNPNRDVLNDISIFNDRQRRLFEYINN